MSSLLYLQLVLIPVLSRWFLRILLASLTMRVFCNLYLDYLFEKLSSWGFTPIPLSNICCCATLTFTFERLPLRCSLSLVCSFEKSLLCYFNILCLVVLGFFFLLIFPFQKMKAFRSIFDRFRSAVVGAVPESFDVLWRLLPLYSGSRGRTFPSFLSAVSDVCSARVLS